MADFKFSKLELVLGAAGLAVASVGLGAYIGSKMAKSDAKSAGAEWPTSSPAAAKKYANPKPIVVVGSVNADMFFDVKQLPAEGETISADVEADYVKPGGKGANQAVACRKLSVATDTNVHFIGRFGNDAHGPWARHTMENAYGVDLTHSTRAGVAMGQAFIYVDHSGRNSIVLVGSANMSWPQPSPLNKAQEKCIASAGLLLLQREIPDAVNIAAAKVAHAAGVRVLMDVGGQDTPLPDDILPYLYALAPNETELARITKLPTHTDAEIAVAAKALLARGVRNVLVTLGTRGSLWFSGDGLDAKQPVFQRCFQAPKVVDTTGAGDCFRAGFATALSEGKTIAQCMAFASAASALCVGVKGAMPSMPARADVLRFLAEQQKLQQQA